MEEITDIETYLNKYKADIYGKEDYPSFLMNSRIAEMYVGMGKYVQSLEFFENALKEFQSVDFDKTIYGRVYLSTLGLYATTLDETGDFANAETMFKLVLQEDPKNFILGDYAFFLHRRKRSYDEAERYFIKALAVFPRHSSIHLKYAGFLRHVRKDMERATKHYKEAVEANPHYADALGSYASFLHSTTGGGDKKLTESLYRRAVEADKTHVNNFCNYGLFLSEELGQFEKAEEMYKAAVAVNPTHANTLYNYAVLLDSHLKRKEEAEILYNKCLEAQPRHAFALYNLAVLREEITGNMINKSSASQHALNILRSKEETSDSIEQQKAEHESNIISEEEQQELLADVSKLYERSVEADPNDFTALADCGRFLCDKLRNFERGEAFLMASLKLNPEGDTALLYMGIVEYMHKGDFDKSLLYFNNILERNPKHVASQHQKARMFIAKYSAIESEKSKQQALLDQAFGTYQNVIMLAAEPGPYATEYLSQVIAHGSLKQKMSCIMFVESTKNLEGQSGDFHKFLSMLKKK